MSDAPGALSPVTVSAADAQRSLAAIEETMTRIRRGIAAAGAPYLIIWGAVWIAGFAAAQFLPAWGGWIFSALDCVGVALSIGVGFAYSRKAAVRSPGERKIFWRIMIFWIAIFAYVFLWMALVRHWEALTAAAFISTVAMFAYVVMGLWFDALYLTLTGFAVTALTLVGYYLLPGWFMLWMAIFGGGTLLGTGLYIRSAWR